MAKEKTYDAVNDLECLLPTRISKASARQRRGRAGRTCAGYCLRLYPKWWHDGLVVTSSSDASSEDASSLSFRDGDEKGQEVVVGFGEREGAGPLPPSPTPPTLLAAAAEPVDGSGGMGYNQGKSDAPPASSSSSSSSPPSSSTAVPPSIQKVLEGMCEYETPELLRTPLAGLCLQIKALGLLQNQGTIGKSDRSSRDGRNDGSSGGGGGGGGESDGSVRRKVNGGGSQWLVGPFLARALEPPDPLAVTNALTLLEEIGALECSGKRRSGRRSGGGGGRKLNRAAGKDDGEKGGQMNQHQGEDNEDKFEDEEDEDANDNSEDENEEEKLTALGLHLSRLPVAPRVGKLLVVGCVMGCLNPALTLAACLAHRPPFVLPMEKKERADEAKAAFADGCCSDHITVRNCE